MLAQYHEIIMKSNVRKVISNGEMANAENNEEKIACSK